MSSITVEQLLDMGDIERCELVRGGIVRIPLAGFEHGHVVMELADWIATHVKAHYLGKVYAAGTGRSEERRVG